MKRRVILLLVCVLLLLCGCSPAREYGNSDEKIKIVTTIFPLYDFTRAVCKDRADIKLLISPGTEVHSFDPSPSDIININGADSFFYIGGESDAWVKSVFSDIKANPIALIECVDLISESHSEHEHEHFDEHVWTSPDNAQLMVKKIANTLCEIDAKNKDFYIKNAEEYCGEIEKTSQKIKAAVDAAENPFLLIADRNPYTYFANAFGLRYEAAFGGCAVGTDISLKTMNKLVETVKENDLKSAYYTEMSNKNIAKALSEQTGVKLYQLNSVHNITLDEFNKGTTYVDLMEENLKVLKAGWEIDD